MPASSGTTTNIEGRITRLGQKLTPPGFAWPDWMIAVELAARLGTDLGFESAEGAWDEIERVAPSHTGVTRAVLGDRRHRDGVVAPLDQPLPEPIGPAPESATDASTGATTGVVPADVDPIADPGIDAVESQGVPATSVTPTDAAIGIAPVVPDGDGPPRPPLLTYSGQGGSVTLPPLDAYSLRLVAGRKLYGQGTLVQRSPSLAGLAPAPCARANPSDLDRLGMGTGGRVRMRSPRANFVVDAIPDPGVPRGSVSLPFNSGDEEGAVAGELIDATAPVTDVRVETP